MKKEQSDKKLNKLILHPHFEDKIKEIQKINVTITDPAKNSKFDFSGVRFPPSGKLSKLEDMNPVKLNAANGLKITKNNLIGGYDESKLNYLSLEGIASFTAHSLIVAGGEDYLPINYLSFYFYTRSSELKKSHPQLNLTEDITASTNYDYVMDRSEFVRNWVIDNSILFVDGPLIGGNMTTYTISLVEELQRKGIIPIFVVKNSDSDLIVDNIEGFKNKYNSDLHWAYKFLKPGERTNFFIYVDEYNKKNAKVFCYIKSFNMSPQRVELYYETYINNKKIINDLIDMTYYLFLAHGDKINPQVRPVAIAEKYARAVLQMSDSYKLIKSSGLIPTMNQQRFGD